MPIHNADIEAIFTEIGELLEIEGENPFKIRAYYNAVRTIEGLGRDIHSMVENGEDLTTLPGIGRELAAKIEEIVATGSCQALEKLRKRLPPELPKLLTIPGLGPKKVRALYRDLNIQSISQLRSAALEHRLRSLPGFGEKTEAKILAAIGARLKKKPAFPLARAVQYAEPLVDYLKKTAGVDRIVVAGSYRRGKETVGDIDILVAAEPSEPIMERFTAYDEVKEVIAKGTTRASVLLRSELQVDLRAVEGKSFGSALHYFTGSKAHNIAMRRLGQQRGLKINEYGVFHKDTRIAGDTEESVFQAVGLPFIPPELRENRGEIEAAQQGRLPLLIVHADIQGDLHVHTMESDGRDSLEEMVQAARKQGLKHLAITEHSKRLTVAHGLNEDRLFKQMEAIDRLNEELADFTILKGIEVDILEDGSLDLPDSVLAGLDLVVGSVHSKFNLSAAKQTERIRRAMDRPHFSILAHPSGRLLPDRPPYEVEMEAVIHHAKDRGCFLELNAHPERLDLTDIYCQMAKEANVLISINSDAHSLAGFNVLRYGVNQARRGWLSREDVLNARSLDELRPLLLKTM